MLNFFSKKTFLYNLEEIWKKLKHYQEEFTNWIFIDILPPV